MGCTGRARRTAAQRVAGAGRGLVVALLVMLGAGETQAQQSTTGVRQLNEAPLGLRETIEIALERNLLLSAARASLDEADRQVVEARGELFPSIDLSMSYTRNISPAVNFLPATFFDLNAPPGEQVAVQFGADNAWNGVVDVEQTLFKPTVFLAVGAARRFRSLREEAVRGEIQGVVTRARTAFYDLLLAQEQHRLIDNSVGRVRKTLHETRALYEAGLSSEYDVLRLEVELANLEPTLARAENGIRRAKRQLAVVLDLENADHLGVEGSLATMDLEDVVANSADNLAILQLAGFEPPPEDDDEGLAALLSSAMDRRPDVRQADLTRDLRHTEMRVEQAQYLPEISLFGAYQITSSQNGDPAFFGAPRAYARWIGVQVTLPVFNGFRREARIGQKRAVLRSAEAQAAHTNRRAESEVRDLVDQVHEARARARGQILAVGQAERGFGIASARYREGVGSQLEVTDAEVALRQSEFNYAQAVYDYLAARARLDAAVGVVPLGEGRVRP